MNKQTSKQSTQMDWMFDSQLLQMPTACEADVRCPVNGWHLDELSLNGTPIICGVQWAKIETYWIFWSEAAIVEHALYDEFWDCEKGPR